MNESFPEEQDATPYITPKQAQTNPQRLSAPMIATINPEIQYHGGFHESQTLQHLQSQYQHNHNNHSQFRDHSYSTGVDALEFEQEDKWNIQSQSNELMGNSKMYGTADLDVHGDVGYSPSQDVNVMNAYNSSPYNRAGNDETIRRGVTDFRLINFNENTRITDVNDCLLGHQQQPRFEYGSASADGTDMIHYQLVRQDNQNQMLQLQKFPGHQMQHYSPDQNLKMRTLSNLNSNLPFDAFRNVLPNHTLASAQFGSYDTTTSISIDNAHPCMMASQIEASERFTVIEPNCEMNKQQNLRDSQQRLQYACQSSAFNDEGDPSNRQNQMLRQMLQSQHEILRKQKFGGPFMANLPNINTQFQHGTFQGLPTSSCDLVMLGAASNNEECQQIPGKKKPRTKDKDKPKRPLSAYNLFFRDERALMLSKIPAKIDGNNNNDIRPVSDDQQSQADAVKDSSRKRKRVLKHGKMGFEEMAKIIGSKWKDIDPVRLKKYQEEANQDRERYKKDIEIYNLKQQTKEAAAHDQGYDTILDKTG
jgi:HMG (high mobility group) box